MALSFKHAFQSAIPDGANPALVQPSNWNEEHEVSTAAGKLLGSDDTGPSSVQELPGSFDAAGNFKLTSATGYFLGAKGSTAQRIAAVAGHARWNTTTVKQEFYDGSDWQNVATEEWTTNEIATAVAAAVQFSTGDIKLTIKTVADAGWLLFADQTIGSATSGATFADAAAEDLFLLLWTNIGDAYAPVTGGRGGSAAADWAANKKIQLLTALGRALGVAGTGSGLTARALGATVGAETVTITATDVGIFDTGLGGVGGGQLGSVSIAPTPKSVMQPTAFLNVMIKL